MGGKILADGLKAQGVELIFGVPGESYLALLDGLYDQRETIRFITCRQEGTTGTTLGSVDYAGFFITLIFHEEPVSSRNSSRESENLENWGGALISVFDLLNWKMGSNWQKPVPKP